MRAWMGLSQHEDPTMLGLAPTCAAKTESTEAKDSIIQ